MSTSSPRLRRWALAALVTNVLIVVTGGTVRVTGSGLGCPDWPACEGSSVVPSAGRGEVEWHQLVEFGNRLLSFVVLAAVVGLLLAAREGGSPRIRRYARLLVLGVLAQAVLGGITVRLDLHWASVTAHFLLSMVLIGIAAVVHHDLTSPPRRGADHPGTRLGRMVPWFGGVVLVLGTVVTATGPHAGDPGTERLGGISIVTAARMHSMAVWVTVGLTIGVVVAARRAADDHLGRAARGLLVVELVQGAVGYWQYLGGVPPQLVLLHMLLATVFWVAAVRVGLRARSTVEEPVPAAAT